MIDENLEILSLTDELIQHFYNNLFNKQVRDVSLAVNIEFRQWDVIKSLRHCQDSADRSGYEITIIYDILISFASFVHEARNSVVKTVEKRLLITEDLPPREKALKRLLITNYPQNVEILAEKVTALYEKTVQLDMEINRDGTPLCLQHEGARNIERLLGYC